MFSRTPASQMFSRTPDFKKPRVSLTHSGVIIRYTSISLFFLLLFLKWNLLLLNKYYSMFVF